MADELYLAAFQVTHPLRCADSKGPVWQRRASL